MTDKQIIINKMDKPKRYCEGIDCAWCNEKEPCIYKIANELEEKLLRKERECEKLKQTLTEIEEIADKDFRHTAWEEYSKQLKQILQKNQRGGRMQTVNEAYYKKLIEKFGAKNQIIVAIEELSELQKEICKYLRDKTNIRNISEEIADVEIMLEQLKLIFENETPVSIEKEYKLARTYERYLKD